MQSFKYATIVLACLLGTCLWFWIGLASIHDAADLADSNLVDCQNIARKIKRLRLQPAMATVEVKEESELSSKLDSLASGVGIQAGAISSIEPHTPRRIGTSNYLNRSTTVRMRGVTLQQTIQIMLGLDDGTSELKVTALQFIAPRSSTIGNSTETWGVEFTVSYLLYSPKSDSNL